MPCVWAAAADFDGVDEALARDPTVADIVETAEFDDEKYYQLEWSDTVKHRIDVFLDKEGSILTAAGSDGGWRARVRFASREQFEAFRAYFTDKDYSFDLVDMIEPGNPHQTFGELTPAQHDALLTAMERGYFRVPRDISTRDLADEFGISHQAFSERLRRGMDTLIDATLTTDTDPPERE
jgi:predicted DNA binding protein